MAHTQSVKKKKKRKEKKPILNNFKSHFKMKYVVSIVKFHFDVELHF